jgi:hypothetical protein
MFFSVELFLPLKAQHLPGETARLGLKESGLLYSVTSLDSKCNLHWQSYPHLKLVKPPLLSPFLPNIPAIPSYPPEC